MTDFSSLSSCIHHGIIIFHYAPSTNVLRGRLGPILSIINASACPSFSLQGCGFYTSHKWNSYLIITK